jgi:aldehyde dehydrogenase family 7 member A1
LGCYNGKSWTGDGEVLKSVSPSSNEVIAHVKQCTKNEYEACLSNMMESKAAFAEMPIPQRGMIVRDIGEELRKYKLQLGSLISLEMGKILAEGIGEVQEFIDICDFAVGLSRSISGQIIPSERFQHSLYEMWNPLGAVGIVTAFNFPCAVLGWNLAVSLICGNVNIWKCASSTSLVCLATMKIIERVLVKHNLVGVVTCVIGPGRTVGELLLHDSRLVLISFTGSSEIGKHVAEVVAGRFGRTILELGGNNATLIMPDADLSLAIRSSVFGAVGTAGQRCTSLRRLLIHEDVYENVVEKLLNAYKSIQIGDPLDSKTLMGPLHTQNAVQEYFDGLEKIKEEGGKILYGGSLYSAPGLLKDGNFVLPTLVEINANASIVQSELFVPILYLIKIKSLQEGIAVNNNVPQGLSSSIFTNDMRNVNVWLSSRGSDCGIVNVNVGTSGAEIGGAFGGEKATGGGRESGSDSWKQYMRRSTCTINYSKDLPLAQGITFG